MSSEVALKLLTKVLPSILTLNTQVKKNAFLSEFGTIREKNVPLKIKICFLFFLMMKTVEFHMYFFFFLALVDNKLLTKFYV